MKVLPTATGIDIHELFGTGFLNVATFFLGAMAGYGGDAVLNLAYKHTFGGQYVRRANDAEQSQT